MLAYGCDCLVFSADPGAQIVRWLPKYNIREWAVDDLIAGSTINLFTPVMRCMSESKLMPVGMLTVFVRSTKCRTLDVIA